MKKKPITISLVAISYNSFKLFEYTCVDNTYLKTVTQAVRKKVDLSYADLSYKDLSAISINGIIGKHINFTGANLEESSICFGDLSDAIFNYANLSKCIITETNFTNAHFFNSNLKKAFGENITFKNADFEDADLRYVHFNKSNFTNARFEDTILNAAILTNCNFSDTFFKKVSYQNTEFSTSNNIPFLPMYLPEGEFIGWKKLQNGVIVKLKILSDSKRSRATSEKCRCDKALVLEFQDIYGNKVNLKSYVNENSSVLKYTSCRYTVGEIVYADKWDNNRWNECSNGIHFFLDRECAVRYPTPIARAPFKYKVTVYKETDTFPHLKNKSLLQQFSITIKRFYHKLTLRNINKLMMKIIKKVCIRYKL